MIRIGNGYDVHQLQGGRRLVLGGVEIKYEKGLLGHSDADVLVHAIMDSLLGACGLRDIGCIFPDTDPKYKDANSLGLLKEVCRLIAEAGYKVGNIDSVIVAQNPKLSPYISEMRANIANALNISIENINVKATTEEWMGFTGNGEGMCAHAVCLLLKKGFANESI